MNGADFTLVLIGPHGAGKTTLGRRLSAELCIPFHEEIGKQMRFEALAQDPEEHAMVSQDLFDEMVTLREIERDLSWVSVPRIVETWHPRNLAYASLRSPTSIRLCQHLSNPTRTGFQTPQPTPNHHPGAPPSAHRQGRD